MDIMILDLASSIQAVGTLIGVMLALLSLLVLLRYAADIKKIAAASVMQTENAQRPFLTIAFIERMTSEDVSYWIVANQGFGPAMSVRFKQYSENGSEKWRSIADMAQGDSRKNLNEEILQHVQNRGPETVKPFIIEYSSLAGFRYRTTVTRMADRELKTSVERLS